MTPLPFLQHTVALYIGFHLDSALPSDWMQKLKTVMPRVKWISIARMYKQRCCGRAQKCKKAMWELAGTLQADPSIEVQSSDYRRSVHGPSWAQSPYAYPDKLSQKPQELTIQLPSSLLSCDTTRWMEISSSGRPDLRRIFKRFRLTIEHINMSLLYHPAVMQQDQTSLAARRVWWNSHRGTKRDIAEHLVEMCDVPGATWTVYHLGDFHPKECSAWSMELSDGFIHDPQPIGTIIESILDAKYKLNDSERPRILLRSRADYLSETNRCEVEDASLARWIELEAKTSEDHEGFTGMYGTWDMWVLLRPSIVAVSDYLAHLSNERRMSSPRATGSG